MRSAASVLGTMLFLASSLGHASAAGPPERGSVRIGLLEPRSNGFALEGDDVDAGFRYYLATHDDRLGGFRVEIRTADEGASPADALAGARQLAEQDTVDAVVGGLVSLDTLGIVDYLDDRKLPIVVTAAGADDLTQKPSRKSLVRVARTASQEEMPLGDYVCRRLGKRTATIVAVDRDFGWESAGGFARAYTDAGCRIVQEQYGAEGSDWNPIVAKLDRGASVVFASVGGIDAVAFLAAYRAAGVRAPLTGDGLLTDERVLAAEREGAIGTWTALHYAATLPVPENTAFREGYESLERRPVSQFVENGYTAAAVLSKALDALPPGAIKSDALAAALRAARVDVPRGPVHFDAYGQIVNDVYVRRVVLVGGRPRNVVIAKYPSVSQFWRYEPAKLLQFPPYAKLKGTWARPYGTL
jgi:branched-chain amino acid transport system substrate-binding protein